MANTRRSEDSRSTDTEDTNHNDDHNEDRDDERHDRHDGRAGEPGGNGRRREPAQGVSDPLEAVREARDQLARLTGQPAEGVSSLARTEDGWALTIEVLELERVPDTMSLLASYEVTLDTRGNLTGYSRTRRYERGRADRK
jgi:hypothetical protein